MSYHDKLLTQVRGKAITRTKISTRNALLRGVREISLRPTSASVSLGTLYDDVSAVGRDMRKALEDIRAGE